MLLNETDRVDDSYQDDCFQSRARPAQLIAVYIHALRLG